MKRKILKIPVMIVLALAFAVIPVSEKQTANAFEYKLIRAMDNDTIGDGVKGKIKILADEENKGYIVEIIHKDNKTYRLKPADKFKYIAGYTPFYDLNMIVADINKDSIPEIITWGSGTHEVPFHVFRWNGSDYKIVLSGWTYSNLGLEDITGDGALELVIQKRIYGTAYEHIYYGWYSGKYRKVYYKLDAARGFEKINALLQMMNMKPAGSPLLYNKDIPDRIKLLKRYFTDEWISKENNMKYLLQFNKSLLSIQITEFLNSKSNLPVKEGPLEETWKFKTRTYRVVDSKVVVEEVIMEIVMKYVEGLGEDRWRIDSIRFTE